MGVVPAWARLEQGERIVLAQRALPPSPVQQAAGRRRHFPFWNREKLTASDL